MQIGDAIVSIDGTVANPRALITNSELYSALGRSNAAFGETNLFCVIRPPVEEAKESVGTVKDRPRQLEQKIEKGGAAVVAPSHPHGGLASAAAVKVAHSTQPSSAPVRKHFWVAPRICQLSVHRFQAASESSWAESRT